MIRPRSLAALFAAALVCVDLTASQAATIISVSGPINNSYTIGSDSSAPPSFEIDAVQWSQTQSYSNVSINASLNATQAGYVVDAYLVEGIVPQTVASQLAHSTVTINAGNGTYTFFSGLTLAAGTYSLVLDPLTSPPNTVGWLSTDSPTIVTDTGVTRPYANYGANFSGTQPYAPDAPDYIAHPAGNLEFSVAGSAVPEPSSLIMLGSAGLLGLCSYGWRRSTGRRLA